MCKNVNDCPCNRRWTQRFWMCLLKIGERCYNFADSFSKCGKGSCTCETSGEVDFCFNEVALCNDSSDVCCTLRKGN